MPDLSDLAPFYSGQVENFYLLVLGQVQMFSGMRNFRIDQDFLIEHWHMIYIMSVVFAEIYV